MNLEYNKPIKVNNAQFEWVKKTLKGMFAYRIDGNGDYWIKPFLTFNHKSIIESNLEKLSKQ